MKTKVNNTILLLYLFLVCSITVSCNDDDSDDNNPLKDGQVELKVYPDENNKVLFNASAAKMIIDWGDGNVETLTPNGIFGEFGHEYTNQNYQTILITTERLTQFGNGLSRGDFKELSLGYCADLKGLNFSNPHFYSGIAILNIKSAPALTGIDCTANQLTSLNVSKCPKLAVLYCNDNNLSASALNSIFNDLPTKTSDNHGVLFHYNNPGTSTCDISIANNKKWW